MKTVSMQLSGKCPVSSIFRGILLTVSCLAVPLPLVAAGSVDMTIKFSTRAVSCEVSAPSLVNLGSIPYGSKRYPPVIFGVACPADTKSEIYAQLVSGGRLINGNASGLPDHVATDGVNWPDSLQFKLEKEKNRAITLDGVDRGEGSVSGFCEGKITRTCTLTPETWAGTKVATGVRSPIIIRFTVRYRT
ncbi:hypothetical protein [Citrobacter portucalensis]|uniref:hypothetical protein n=1 Tax=Citrobacter portucalensis TaxID=1639133 RepID=UPI00288B1BC9|nr:hypothetical protein [Citrobacter portucalensis]WNI88054.1 hypothetical protein RIK60_09940 [Citrobacter portucalensis]